MNSPIKKAFTGCLTLLIVACAPYYQQTYYPADGAYGGYNNYGGYGVIQQSYYEGYPSHYQTYSYPYSGQYHFEYNDRRYEHDNHYYSRYKGSTDHNVYVKPNPSSHYNHYHSDRKHEQTAYQAPVPRGADHSPHSVYGDEHRDRPSPNRPSERKEHKDNLPQPYGRAYGMNRNDERRHQGRWPRQDEWDAKNRLKEQWRLERENYKMIRNENRESQRTHGKKHRADHKERFSENQRYLN